MSEPLKVRVIAPDSVKVNILGELVKVSSEEIREVILDKAEYDALPSPRDESILYFIRG